MSNKYVSKAQNVQAYANKCMLLWTQKYYLIVIFSSMFGIVQINTPFNSVPLSNISTYTSSSELSTYLKR